MVSIYLPSQRMRVAGVVSDLTHKSCTVEEVFDVVRYKHQVVGIAVRNQDIVDIHPDVRNILERWLEEV